MKILPLLLLLLPLHPLFAKWESGDRRSDEEPRVVLYSGENFEGVSVELEPRTEIANLGDLRFSDGRSVNDRVSSIRIFGGLRVALYADADFRGRSIEITDNVRQLGRLPLSSGGMGNWDNCLSSIRIGPGSARWHDEDNRPRHHDRGYDTPPHPDRDSDRLSSAEVERMIERAFRELLRREPTGREIRQYRERVVAEDWDRDRLYDDLRSSKEYRTREADVLIGRVYREMFGREPDAPSRAVWLTRLVDKGWSERRFREEMTRFDEYRVYQARKAQEKQRH